MDPPLSQAQPGVVPEADREAVRRAVLAGPPLTDEQVDALAEVIINARVRRAAQRRQAAG
jgi:hypothetical protein